MVKIINAAHKTGEAPLDLAQRFIDAFMEDTTALGIEPATAHPRASQMIPDIIEFVQDLIDKEYAYAVDGDVYYRARKFKHYGELSHQNVDELEEGASQHITQDELAKKEDPIDFALWKAAKPGEISWESPWGKGRPGWHIECSVMSTKLLGDTFDIHGGGQDLEFPHHENEIAQSEAKTDKQFVRYWMHNGFVTIGEDDEKMSKSLGNFITVHDIRKTVDPQVLRFFMAGTQYRMPIRYSETNLKNAANSLNRLKIARENLTYRRRGAETGVDPQITKQLHKLVDVLRVNDYEEDVSLERELVLMKLPTPNRNTRDEVRSLCEIFSAKIIDVTAEVYTVQYVGSAEEVDNFIATVGKCSEILETVRSGVLGIAKGNHFMHS